jgi:hypothetical protein
MESACECRLDPVTFDTTDHVNLATGALTAPGLVGPEHGAIMLVFGGTAFIILRFRRLRTRPISSSLRLSVSRERDLY